MLIQQISNLSSITPCKWQDIFLKMSGNETINIYIPVFPKCIYTKWTRIHMNEFELGFMLNHHSAPIIIIIIFQLLYSPVLTFWKIDIRFRSIVIETYVNIIVCHMLKNGINIFLNQLWKAIKSLFFILILWAVSFQNR